MAEVKDGIYAQAAGTVSKRFSSRNGAALVLDVKPEGAKYADRVTVWGVDFEANPGDRISVKGWLSWRKETKDDKAYFNVSLNKPILVSREAVSAVESWSTATPGEGWQTGEVRS